MNDSTNLSRRGLALILILHIALGIAFSIVVPLWDAPDELRHFIYVKYLADHASLPPLSDKLSENPVSLAFHPPLYHALMAPLAAGFPLVVTEKEFPPATKVGNKFYVHWAEGTRFPYAGIPLRVHLIRLVSLALGTIVVYLTWHIGRIVFPEDRWFPFVATCVVGLNPQFIFISATVNDNSLSAVFGALTLLMLAVAIVKGVKPWLILPLGLALGGALLSTTSAILLVPVLVAGLFASDLGIRKTMSYSAGAVLVAGAVAGWWYVRNAILCGDPLLWEFHKNIVGNYCVRGSPMGIIDFLNTLRLIHRSFWGVFGSMGLPLAAPIYWVLEICTGLIIAGVVRCIVYRRDTLQRTQLRVFLVFFFAALLFFVSVVHYNFTFWSPQGRYLFVVLPAFGILGTVGLLKGIGGQSKLIAMSVFTALLLFNAVALLFFVWPAYV
ncbi:MAG: hypothetical protein C4532_09615 [Candidatus Abyssobacteria bacterium SURF_17]|uniref:Uncharacterized protein n=1 Tax=Candidatus Abyssobacteria bacterium SURF_17 TaxID=2093361 RepID=A0A419EZ62_9BACT|nr:MAG: hypothetical protein C4532_09615 [Candidatus Abyssubacteria bacterium SURF_17]